VYIIANSVHFWDGILSEIMSGVRYAECGGNLPGQRVDQFACLKSCLVLGTLSVEAIYQDRDQFAQLVREVAAPDVGRMGIEILSFTIKDVYDSVEYLESLGRAQTANVKRDADIGVAEANRDAGIRVRQVVKSLSYYTCSKWRKYLFMYVSLTVCVCLCKITEKVMNTFLMKLSSVKAICLLFFNTYLSFCST